jgi:hypothetical protein
MQLMDWRAKMVMVFLSRFQHERLLRCLKKIHGPDQSGLDELSRFACRILFAKENEKSLSRVRSRSDGEAIFVDPETNKKYIFHIGDFRR